MLRSTRFGDFADDPVVGSSVRFCPRGALPSFRLIPHPGPAGRTRATLANIPFRDTRLRRSKDFQRTYAQGVRVRGPSILVVAAPGLNPDTPRLGLSVGRKYSKSAVIRNRLRRRLKAVFRETRPDLPCLDLVVVPLRPLHPYPYDDLRDELMTLIRKASRKLSRRSLSG